MNTPPKIGILVQQAFVLEALADKQDCTSRYTDLPNKPLEDFAVAGINAGPYFSQFALDRTAGSKEIYKYLVPSLRASNFNKSSKYINMGLLEVMFNVVAARLSCSDPDKVAMNINEQLRKASVSDAKALIKIRKVGWSTSNNKDKFKLFDTPALKKARDPYEFNELLYQFADKSSASYQWGEQSHNNWPLIQEIFVGLQSAKDTLLLDKISSVFNPIRQKNPDIRIGILADMCAAAIFLHLSFLEYKAYATIKS